MAIVAIERQIQKMDDDVAAKEFALKCLDAEIAKMEASTAPSVDVAVDKPVDELDWFAVSSETTSKEDVEPVTEKIFTVDVPVSTPVADDLDDRTPIEGTELVKLGMTGDFISVDRGDLPNLGSVISYKDLPDDMQKSLQHWEKQVIDTLNRSTTLAEVRELDKKLAEQIQINETRVRQLEALKTKASASRKPAVAIDYDRQLVFGLNLEQIRGRVSAFINSLLRAEKEELLKQRDTAIAATADLEFKFDAAIEAYAQNEQKLIKTIRELESRLVAPPPASAESFEVLQEYLATIARLEEEKAKFAKNFKKSEADLSDLLNRFDQLEAREKADIEKGIQSSRNELAVLMAGAETSRREYEKKLADLVSEEGALRTKKAELDDAQREIEKRINETDLRQQLAAKLEKELDARATDVSAR
jgi:hypothetical protein